MLPAILAAALIVSASLACGQALMLASGRERFSPVAPAAGLSALLVVCGIAVKLPGHGTTAAIAAAIATAAAVAYLWRGRGALGPVRLGALAAVAGAALVVAIPFATSGRVGILGQGLINDDMASHLLFTEWVDTREGPTPDLVEDGYPLGPHAVVSAASKASGADLVESFAGLTGAIAVLAALTAFGALRGVRPLLRPPAAVLAALPYLGAAYLAQGAFKEPMMGLALVGFALALPALRSSGSLRLAAIPPGVIAAGTIYNYSFPGLAWLVIAVAAWLGLIAWRERSTRGGLDLGARLRELRPALAVGAAIPVALAVPELVSLLSFTDFAAFNPSGEGGNTGFGNLRQALNPLEALGVWPSSEFRVAPQNSSTPVIAFYLGGLLGLLAFGWGLARALARRETALPAVLVAGVMGYLVAVAAGTPYTSAKALAILAPVAMLIALRGLLSADALEGEGGEHETGAEARPWPPQRLRAPARVAIPALTLVFAAAAAFSTLLPLRQSAVGPTDTAEELIGLRPHVQDEDVLFLGRDNFISWELLGAHDVFAPILNHYDTEETSTLYRATPINAKFDWDNVPAEPVTDDPGDRGLADFDWVLTTTAAFNSQAPPEFEPREVTDHYVLWERRETGGETVPANEPRGRRTLVEPLFPGATLDCADPAVASLAKLDGTAAVFPSPPVIGKAWDPGPDITDAAGTVEELLLPPGRYAISIQYASTQDLTIAAPGLDATLPANLLFRGPAPYYPVGELVVPEGDGGGAVRFDVTVERPPLAGRLLGAESRAYLGRIAATPLGAEARETVPLSEACGRYVDWYSLEPGTSLGELNRIGAPEPRPPQDDA